MDSRCVAECQCQWSLHSRREPFLLDTYVEWAFRPPPRLRGTEQPLVLQFFGAVLRCGVVNKENLSYGIASESLKSKYLPKEQAAKLDALFAQSGSSD